MNQHQLALPVGHRFPIGKYAMLHEQAERTGLGDMRPAPATDWPLLALVHTPDYLARLQQGTLSASEQRRIGFPWSPQLVERARHSVGATLAACRAALAEGVAASLAGGTHHAYADHGEGYCVLNDTAVAARVLQAETLIQRLLVIDLDVHQGNGTAAIFANEPAVFTFSIHGARNYPFHKEASDLDLALADGTEDAAYMAALEWSLAEAIERSHADLAIYLAGADPYHADALGRLSMSMAGLKARDAFVLDTCHSAGLPVAITMAGGYARPIEDTVAIHLQTLTLAAQYATRWR